MHLQLFHTRSGFRTRWSRRGAHTTSVGCTRREHRFNMYLLSSFDLRMGMSSSRPRRRTAR